jgi:hypothetical protein
MLSQTINSQPHIMDAQVRFEASPCGICGGKSGPLTDALPSTLVFPSHTVTPPNLHSHSSTTSKTARLNSVLAYNHTSHHVVSKI